MASLGELQEVVVDRKIDSECILGFIRQMRDKKLPAVIEAPRAHHPWVVYLPVSLRMKVYIPVNILLFSAKLTESRGHVHLLKLVDGTLKVRYVA